uniref:Fe2OG dioxygenase domain-containing protein n=1 Tax=Guillardia theta TaxID=55529 RepID=A0A7S4PJJ5_GUITH|mmetsp:Transcript_52543/g.163068  ORF Transcript_52543/g.163068 Transcript_52543/m.163068 type:complete len:401 (+) Transcript_52543:136-1338(+)
MKNKESKRLFSTYNSCIALFRRLSKSTNTRDLWVRCAVLTATVVFLASMMWHWIPQKTSLNTEHRAQPSSQPAVARARCSPTVDMHHVGSCKPFASFQQDCSLSPEQAYSRILTAAAAALKGEKVREVKQGNGVTLINEYLPTNVWVLSGDELFVFPTCEVGDTFDIPLPSANRNSIAKVRSISPRVLEVEDFLTPEECHELISSAKPLMSRSTVSAEGDSAVSLQESSRTSSTAWLPPHSHTLANKLYDRVSSLVGIDFRKHEHVVVEDLQVLRYEVNQHYHIHHDYFDPVLHRGFLQGDGRNRFITAFFYLTDVERGGETCFPMTGDPRPITDYSDCNRGLRVPPKRGKAIIFYSLLADGQRSGGLDVASWHGGCDVHNGTKWAANYWITLKGVHPQR